MKPLFILGCPRSGTTMLQQALNRHSQIVIPPETKLFFSFVGRCPRCQAAHLKRLNSDLGIAIRPEARRVQSNRQIRAFFGQVASLYLERLGRREVAYFGDKTPEHTPFFSQIRRVFPEARFLLIYRDGRDVALSLSKAPWMRPNVLLSFTIWLFYVRAQSRFEHETCVHRVRYEDLVVAPDRELKRVTDFLGLAYEPAMAEGYGNAEGVPIREYAWKAKALEKISPDRIGVWRKELSPNNVAVMERLGGPTLRALGYEPAQVVKARLSISCLARLAWHGLAFFSRLPFHALSNQVLGRPLCMH